MQQFPSVCIMIPTYNQAGCIAMAVESALRQDYPNLQIFVADDHSTDDTEAVLAPFVEQGKIKYYKNPTNIGRVANYRKCLYEYAHADWVLNLDGDDYFTNNTYISQAMQAIEKAGREEVLFFQGMNIFKTDKKETIFKTGVNQDALLLRAKDYFFRFIALRHFSHMSTVYNRAAAINSGFYEKNILSVDIYSFLLAALNNPGKKVILSNLISGVWLQHDDNASGNAPLKQHWQNYRLYQQLYHIAVRKGYHKIACIRWRLSAFIQYSRAYLGGMVRRFIGK
jgi:glycosyltransferase involved in cell wall biosynthesis